MKQQLSLLCLLISASMLAQTKTITVLDRQNNTPLEGVKVKVTNKNVLSTNANGQVKVNQHDTAELSYIGYSALTIAFDTVTKPLVMQPETYELNDVTIQATKRKKYTAKVLPKEGLRSLKMQNYGTGAPLHNDEEAAVYIPVDAVKNGAVVTGIFFQPTDYRTLENGKYLNHAGAKHAPFKANVYYADAKSHAPLTPVFEEDFEVKLEEGEKYAVIKLDESQKFTFPAEGICIVVRACAADYYHALGFKSAPAFDKLDVGKKNMFWQFRKALYQGDEAEWKTEFLFATRNEIYRFDVEVEYYE
jgi:hypothetical protein